MTGPEDRLAEALVDAAKAVQRVDRLDMTTTALETAQDTYLSGLIEGRLAAEGNTDVLIVARQEWGSHACGFELALNYANFAAGALTGNNPAGLDAAYRQIVWACGVREGFKEATQFLPDAQVCQDCDERVLPNRDPLAVQCEDHGWFCCADERAAFCVKTCSWPEDVAA